MYIYVRIKTNKGLQMTTSIKYTLTSEQKAVIIKLQEIQAIEENNNFANGDAWNNAQDMITDIELTAQQNALSKYANYTSIELNCD